MSVPRWTLREYRTGFGVSSRYGLRLRLGEVREEEMAGRAARAGRDGERGAERAHEPAGEPKAEAELARRPGERPSGDHVVVTDNTYGGTYRLFERVLRKFELDFTYVDTSSLPDIEAAIRPETRMLFLETPTNPILRLTDLAGACDIARGRDVTVAVDNTFASPAVQRPIDFGADIVIHSTTKFLNGHRDSVGGVFVAVRDVLETIGSDRFSREIEMRVSPAERALPPLPRSICSAGPVSATDGHLESADRRRGSR